MQKISLISILVLVGIMIAGIAIVALYNPHVVANTPQNQSSPSATASPSATPSTSQSNASLLQNSTSSGHNHSDDGGNDG